MQVPVFKNRQALLRGLNRWGFWRRAGKPNARHLELLANAVYAWDKSAAFEFYLVGSFLDPDSSARDIDLVVRGKPDHAYDLNDIEDVLIAIEYFGLYTLDVSIDTTFRELSEAAMQARALTGEPFSSVKLYAAKWKKLARSNPNQVRTIGRYLVEIQRSIEQTSYFKKLPYLEASGRRYRVHRPAVALSQFRSMP